MTQPADQGQGVLDAAGDVPDRKQGAADYPSCVDDQGQALESGHSQQAECGQAQCRGQLECVIRDQRKLDAVLPGECPLLIGLLCAESHHAGIRLAEIRQAVSLPVIANGEIWSVADFERCRKVSGCEDFMLGRGLLARPDLALAIRAHTEGRSHSALDWLQILSILQGYFAQSASAYPGKYCGNRLKQWLMYLQRQYPQAQTFFESIKRARDPQEIHAAFAQSQRLCA